MSVFAPVTTLADLEALDHSQIVEGYTSAERGDPEPGENRGRAFWHGWRCRQMDYGELKSDAGHWQLVCEIVAANRVKSQAVSS